jgi:geranylgeranyl pyrophosphate synthase
MAFQLIDDLLDLTSTRETLGKPVVSDLKEGKMTLPVSFVMRDADVAAKVRVVLKERGFSSVESSEILRAVDASGGLTQTRSRADSYARQAEQLLQQFPPSIYRDALASIPGFILSRTA